MQKNISERKEGKREWWCFVIVERSSLTMSSNFMEMNEWNNAIKLSASKVAKFFFRQRNCEVINRNGFQPVQVFNLTDGSYLPSCNLAMHLLIISTTIESVCSFRGSKISQLIMIQFKGYISTMSSLLQLLRLCWRRFCARLSLEAIFKSLQKNVVNKLFKSSFCAIIKA